MSKTIDDRIVRMTFDTNKFQNGVKGVLDGLKSIDTKLAAKRTFSGLDNIGKSIADVTGRGMTGLMRSIDETAGRFSALEIAGITALANISNRAVNAGLNLMKSLTLDPIMDGFGEYETKMTSIQTILTNTASKGVTLKDVTSTLDELNVYADKTIYNFAEMTKNIGTFTAAGVDLDKATTAIKGIANLGAGSGSSSAQVSTAMYQMSQALSTGYLMLQDYNSLVNAGMGGELFKKEAIAVAKSMGIATPAINNFRESLQDKWLTDDVMIKVFENFANDEMLTQAATEVKTLTGLIDTLKESVASGWAQTWESIIGDKDQAAKLFTSISNGINNGIINPMADARAAVIDTWNEMGGRENLIQGFTNIFESLGKILGPIGQAFNDVFPKSFGTLLGNITKGFLRLTETFKVNGKVSKFIGDIFKTLFGIINGGFKIVGLLLQPLGHLYNIFSDIVGVAGSLVLAFFDMIYAIGDYIRNLQIVKDIQKVFADGMKFIQVNADKFVKAFDNAIKNIRDFFSNLIDGIGGLFKSKKSIDDVKKTVDETAETAIKASKSFDGVKTVGDFVKRSFENLKIAGENIVTMFKDAKQGAIDTADGLKHFVLNLGDYIKNSPVVVKSTEFLTEAFNTLKDAIEGVKDFFKSIDFSPIINAIEGVKRKLEPIVKFITNIFDTIVGAFKSMFDELDLTGGQFIALLGGFAAGFGIFKIFGKIGEVIGNILNPVGNLSDAAVGVLEGVKDVLTAYQNDLQSKTLLRIGQAVLMLSGALLVLSQLDIEQVKSGLLGVVGILASVVTALGALILITSGANLKGFFSISSAFITLSIAVMNISLAIFLLSSLGMEDLSVGLLGIAGGMTMLVLALGAVGTMTGSIVRGAFAMMLLATALNILYLGILMFSLMDVTKMNNSLMSVGLALGILVIACKGLNKVTSNIAGTAAGIILLSTGLLIMASACKKFGELDTGVIIQGLISVTLILGALSLFNASTKSSKMSFSMGAGLMGLAKALSMLYKPVSKFGQLPLGELVKGIGSLGLVMAGLTLMTNTIKPSSGMKLIGLGVGLSVMAGAISIFSKEAVKLSSLPFGELLKGLSTMTLALGVIKLATMIVPEKSLITLALGVGALGLAFKVFTSAIQNAGNVEFGTLVKGLTTMAGILLVLEFLLRINYTTSLFKIGTGMMVLSLGFTAMGNSITKLGEVDFKTIAKGIGSMLALVGIMSLMNIGMGGMGLTSMAVGVGLMAGALTLMAIPLKIMGSMPLQNIGIGLIAIAGVLTILGAGAMLLTPLVPVLFGLATSIGLLGSGMLAASGGLALFSLGFAAFATTVGLFGDELLAFFVSFAQKLPELVTNVGLAFVALLEVIGQNGPQITESVFQILEAVINAIIQTIPLAANAMVNFIVTVLNVLAENIPKLLDAGVNLIVALLDGIGRTIPRVIDKMVELLVLMANSLMGNAVILIDAGIQLIIQLINGIADGIDSNSQAFAEAVNNLIISALTAVLNLGKEFFKRGSEFVVEMISGLFSKDKEVKTTATDVADAGVSGAESTNPEWKSAGSDFSAGMAKGISSGKAGVVSTARNVARSAALAIKQELDINSPSKVTTELGMWTSKGLAGGITKFGYLAERAGKTVASNTVYGLNKELNNVAMIDGVDYNPVIKPVMDLTNFKSGYTTLGRMINSTGGIVSAFGGLDSRLSTDVGAIQNGKDNSDVVKAITKLRTDINNIKGTTNIIDGITYDDGSNINNTISDLVRMAKIERRI